MKNFIKTIFKTIKKLDKYTTDYKKRTAVVELPSLAYVNWGIYLANKNEFDKAIEKFETSIAMAQQTPSAYLNLGIVYAKKCQYEKAIENFRKTLKLDAKNVRAYSLWGTALVEMGQYKESEYFFKKAKEIDSGNPEVYVNYGVALARQEKREKAKEMFKFALFYDPTNYHALYLWGILLFETENYDESIEKFDAVLELYPVHPQAFYYKGLAFFKLGNYKVAYNEAKKAHEILPIGIESQLLMAESMMMLKKQDECLSIYEKAQNNEHLTPQFYISWGIALQNFNLIKEAKEKFYTALQIAPTNNIVLMHLGICFMKENNIDEAMKIFEKILETEEKNADAIANIGLCLYKKQEYENALNKFLSAVKLSRKSSFLYFYIANCYYHLRDIKKSMEYYETTLEYLPDHIEALLNYSNLLMETGNDRDAIRKIRHAYQLEPKSSKINFMYSLALLKLKLFKESIEKSDYCLTIDNNFLAAKYVKAEALLGLKRPHEALGLIQDISDEKRNTQEFLHISAIIYTNLAQLSPSDYNINTAIECCNKVIDHYPEEAAWEKENTKILETLKTSERH
ncbi:MAG: DUF3808 domain-containing protein [Candidatus Gastranaerophilales bacterium]|nr:DUF3808 domain-containing protein [Candidatus Gastranaerophilales bacterium]